MGGVTEWALVPRDPTDEMVDAAWDSDAVDYVGEHKRIHSATAAWTAMLAAAPTPPVTADGFTAADMMDARKEGRERMTGAQVVASLREMLELREATQNGRVTEKHELDIVRDARAALSAQPRPSSVDRWGIPPCVECGAVDATDAETKCHCSGDKDDCHGVALWPDGDTQPASAPVGVDAAKHWHDLYRAECLQRRDDAARYGQQIIDLESLAQQPAATLPDEDDSDLTVAYMAGRHDGRKESRQPAAADDPIARLIRMHADLLAAGKNYAYFELAYTRTTGWMAFITDKPLHGGPVVNPDRVVIARGQGDTPHAACSAALAQPQGEVGNG